MSKSDELDQRTKLRSNKNRPRTIQRRSEDEELHAGMELRTDLDPSSVLDDIWATPYSPDTHALSQLELRLYKQKRRIYEVQRLLGQTVESLTILLGILHSTLEDL